MAGGLAWALWALAMVGLAVFAWLDHLLRQAGRADLLVLTPPISPRARGGGRGHGRGGAGQPPAPPPGWLADAGLRPVPERGPVGPGVHELLGGPCRHPASRRPGCPVVARHHRHSDRLQRVILLLTPTGALPSPRWRWWAGVTAATPVALLLVLTLIPGPVIGLPGGRQPARPPRARWWAASRLPGRLRHHHHRLRGGRRLAGGALPPRPRHRSPAAAVAGVGHGRGRPAGVVHPAALALGAYGLAPLAAGLARRSCRRRSARRSCATGCMTWTASSAAPWPRAADAAAGRWLRRGGAGAGQRLGRNSPLAVAAATPGRGAVFQPARRRVQAVVDQRCNRRRHDAARIIEGSVPACATRSTSTP